VVEYEYALVVVGQENGRPWGTKAEGFTQNPDLNRTLIGFDLTNIVIAAGEETGNGKVLSVSTLLVPDALVGMQMRLGPTSAPLGGYATIIANTTTTVTVNWVVAAASDGTFQGYVVRPNDPVVSGAVQNTSYDLYPNVRVLVPYQPEGPDVASNAVPYPAGAPIPPPTHIVPPGIGTHEDWGLFLEFSFLEGIASHGVSEATDSYTVPEAHACSGVAAGSFTVVNTSLGIIENAFAGGYIRVTHANGTSWARIATNTGVNPAVFNLDTVQWTGNGIPATGAGFPAVSDFIYEAWVPHHGNSPHAYYPGPGFRYPTNDMQPCAAGDGRIKNFPRRITSSSYGDRFGPLLELGWRLSAKLGKRINLIHLSVNDTTLIPRTLPNTDGFLGTLGWWNHALHSDWSPAKTGGLADRVKKMIQTIAPAAMVAEGNTNPLRILGIVMPMGEGDAVSAAGRESYGATSNDFVSWLRGVIGDAVDGNGDSLSPYDAEAKIPVVHPRITADPWENIANDDDGLVNASIRELMAADGFGATIDPEDSPKLVGDSSHFNGVGEALNGNLASIAMAALINEALAYGSDVVENSDAAVLQICNEALSHIGESNISSLDPTSSTQAQQCDLHYSAVRDELLEDGSWGFAIRRAQLVPVAAAPPSSWLFSYVLPPDVWKPLAVLHPDATGDHYAGGTGVPVRVWEVQVAGTGHITYTTEPYGIEQADGGHQVLHTNVENAVLRYVVRVVDATRYSPLFKRALAYKLAAMLAGPIVKGQDGAALSQRLLALSELHVGKARTADAQKQKPDIEPRVPWVAGR
jgi:hypothetical protein